ncbi:hypothetical protein HPP92_024913 [Vanilla planifolia]|uniref:Bet v I/Major latex protein domain-containing protein n=1 Tax=Vanilla planifolia TaxID=51239 RepID=A0A835PLS8_VANPL|nr:hypothetical protein HPP92_025196 [Vanilla planifolia]KAG0453609.1 hypothetical protein HPP92_024913 [Vanilla planifolia]
MSSSWSLEIETTVPAARLFKAAFLDWHNLGSKLLPEVITSVALLSGDGSPGSIRQINFTSVVPFKYVKERLDHIDHEKLEVKITLVEGGGLGKKIESANSYFKIESKGSGSVVKFEGTHKVIPGADISDDLEKAKESIVATIKATEGYLLANPNAYA